MKDWPIPLRISAEAVFLAEAIYTAQCHVYGPQQPVPFAEFVDRASYHDLACSVLKALEPQRLRRSESALEMAAAATRRAFRLIRSR